jgi:hypothetical protein
LSLESALSNSDGSLLLSKYEREVTSYISLIVPYRRPMKRSKIKFIPVQRKFRVISKIFPSILNPRPSVVRTRMRKSTAATIIRVLPTENIIFEGTFLWMIPRGTSSIMAHRFPIPRNIPINSGDQTIKPKKKTHVRWKIIQILP